MNAFKILLTDKLLGMCSLSRPTQNRLLAISCRVREGAGGVCLFGGGKIPTSIATRFFITKYHP